MSFPRVSKSSLVDCLLAVWVLAAIPLASIGIPKNKVTLFFMLVVPGFYLLARLTWLTLVGMPWGSSSWLNLYKSFSPHGATEVRYLAARAGLLRIRCYCMCYALLRDDYIYLLAPQEMSQWRRLKLLWTQRVGLVKDNEPTLRQLIGLDSESSNCTPSS